MARFAGSGYLDWILAPHSRRRLPSLDPRVRVLLRMTAYQIAFLERVPAFAAVNDAVTLAPRSPGVSAFVNAVLRSFARRGAREREPAPPRNPIDALAARCSFPTWIVERWVVRYGRDEAESLMRALNERPPLTLRANRLRITRDELGRRLADEDGLDSRPTRLAPEGLVVGPGGAPGEWRAFVDGGFAVQDEASMLIARLLAPEPGATVADVCAAPGTKTTHLAELMDNRGRILAFDREPTRLARVGEAAARLGISIIDAREGPVESLAPGFSGRVRRRSRRRAVLEPGRAAPQSRGEVAAPTVRHRAGEPAPAGDPGLRGCDGSARRAPGLRHVLTRARGERRRRAGVPGREAGVPASIRPTTSRCRSTPPAGSAACRTGTARTASPPSASAARGFGYNNSVIKIAPSILSADFAALASDIARVEAGGADQLHVDVMDGRFVPNITIGPLVVAAIRKRTRLPLDVHLMIVEPERYVAGVRRGRRRHGHGARRSLHASAAHARSHPRARRASRRRAEPVDAALGPGVRPRRPRSRAGDVGQPRLRRPVVHPERAPEDPRARKLLGTRPVDVSVDGGVKAGLAKSLAEDGASTLVAGSAVFGAADPAAAVRAIRAAATA